MSRSASLFSCFFFISGFSYCEFLNLTARAASFEYYLSEFLLERYAEVLISEKWTHFCPIFPWLFEN